MANMLKTVEILKMLANIEIAPMRCFLFWRLRAASETSTLADIE